MANIRLAYIKILEMMLVGNVQNKSVEDKIGCVDPECDWKGKVSDSIVDVCPECGEPVVAVELLDRVRAMDIMEEN